MGAPYRINYGNEALVVLQVNAPAYDGEVQFSFKMMGEQYKWFEYPFVGIRGSVGWYWVTMVLILIGLLLVVGSPVLVPLALLLLVGGGGAFIVCVGGIVLALGSVCCGGTAIGGGSLAQMLCCCCCCCCRRRRGGSKRKAPRRNVRGTVNRRFGQGR